MELENLVFFSRSLLCVGSPVILLPRGLNFPLSDAGGFWLEVLPDQPMQYEYAGTLQYDLHGSQLLMEKFFKRFRSSACDERDAAALFAQATFRNYGSPVVSLMRCYAKVSQLLESLFPTLVATHSTSIVRSPDWKNCATERALSFSPTRFSLSSRPHQNRVVAKNDMSYDDIQLIGKSVVRILSYVKQGSI
jgi:hypothetical protein